jgi:anti-sigma regulatory factor (Ser/Thr protein kinase)
MATELRDPRSFDYHFDAGHENALWLVRQMGEQWLREHGVRDEAVSELLLVTTELCTGAAGMVELEMRIDGTNIEIVVATAGRPSIDMPAGDLRLAAALCDELVLRVRPGRTVAIARRHGAVLP